MAAAVGVFSEEWAMDFPAAAAERASDATRHAAAQTAICGLGIIILHDKIPLGYLNDMPQTRTVRAIEPRKAKAAEQEFRIAAIDVGSNSIRMVCGGGHQRGA